MAAVLYIYRYWLSLVLLYGSWSVNRNTPGAVVLLSFRKPCGVLFEEGPLAIADPGRPEMGGMVGIAI